jgi:HK97 gp10 family phage protein
MGVTAKIAGLSELQTKLDALPTKLAKRILRPALQDAGEIVQQAAGIRAPRKSGHLTTNVVVNVTVHSDLQAEVKVGPDKSAFYGIYSELGTSPHPETSKDGKTWPHPGEPARPWLRPAFAESVDEYTNALIQNIRDGLDEVTK